MSISISELWKQNKDFFIGKSINQIIAITGEGKLSDYSDTSNEFREFLENIPSEKLRDYANECLSSSFTDSGIILQDIVNEIGTRLSFKVEYGLYRGRKNAIGYDGIWNSKDGHNYLIEVKTTDAYRINLSTIAKYRDKLIEKDSIEKDNSSILIIVGRQDTGDLEAQIRGSRFAWDIRLISTDSLIQLLFLKEKLNDAKTLQQINKLLKPQEYTRIDNLIELIFLTSRDLELDDDTELDGPTILESKEDELTKKKFTPVSFHDECVERISEKLNVKFIKQSKVSYESKDHDLGLICSVSKIHKTSKYKKYWFAFHPHQQEYLEEYQEAYVGYGCGDPRNTILFRYDVFKDYVPNLWTTENEDRMYWHVVILEKGERFYLQQPLIKKGEVIDITDKKI